MRYLILLLVIILAAPAAFAATVAIYPDGEALVSVPVSQYINVFTESRARVSKRVNSPSTYVLETGGNVSATETAFGPYTTPATIKIEAGPGMVYYSVGASALKIPVVRPMSALSPAAGSVFRIPARLVELMPVPTAMTTAATITSAALLGGIITGNHTAGATAAYTLPTGTLLEAAAPYIQIGEGFEWTLINLSAAAADSITLTAGTDHTIVGAPIVISVHVTTGGAITSMGCSSSTWITKKTAANTFVTYRKN